MSGWRCAFASLGLVMSPGLALSAEPWSLSAEGYGPAHVGMTMEQVERALGAKLTRPTAEDLELNAVCHDASSTDGRFPGMSFMFEEGKLARISVYRGGDGAPGGTAKTAQGIGIGSQEADVRRAYGASLVIETAEYDEEPAHSLLFWVRKGESGVRFVTDQKSRVGWIHAGGGAIEYIEGCS